MTFRAVTLLAICLLLVDIHAPPMHAQDARSDAVVWTGNHPGRPRQYATNAPSAIRSPFTSQSTKLGISAQANHMTTASRKRSSITQTRHLSFSAPFPGHAARCGAKIFWIASDKSRLRKRTKMQPKTDFFFVAP